MKNKAIFSILIGTVAIGISYMYNKYISKQKKEYYYKQALENIKNQNYKNAIYFFEKINEKTENIYRNMIECYILIENYGKAIEIIDKCLFNNLNLELLEKKYLIKKKNRELANSFKDVFLLNLLTQKYREETTFLLKKISERKAREYKINGWTSKICFKEFFDTLEFLNELNSPLIVFLNSGEYMKCYNYVKDQDGELELFINGCIKMLNGDWIGAMNNFKKKEYIYSKIMSYWLQTRKNAENMGLNNKNEKKLNYNENVKLLNSFEEDSLEDLVMEDGFINMEKKSLKKQEILFDKTLLEEFSKKKDPTILFYLSKIYENLEEYNLQKKYLNEYLEIKRTAHGVGYNLVCMIKQQDQKNIEKEIKEAIFKFSEDINIYCIAIEYFIITKNEDKAIELLQQLEIMNLKDPRIFILKFLVAKLKNEVKVIYLKEAIKIDPLYLKSYVFLGKEEIENEEAIKILEDALICAKTFDELYIIYQLKTIAETHQELRKKYPNILQNEK